MTNQYVETLTGTWTNAERDSFRFVGDSIFLAMPGDVIWINNTWYKIAKLQHIVPDAWDYELVGHTNGQGKATEDD